MTDRINLFVGIKIRLAISRWLPILGLFGLCYFPFSVWSQTPDTVVQESISAPQTDHEDLETAEVLPEAFRDVPMDYQAPPLEPIAMREIDQDKWKDASSGQDYSHDLPEQKKQQQTNNPNRDFNFGDWNASTAFLGQIMQVIAIILALLAIAYAIYRTMQAPRNRRIGQAEDGTIITADNVDAYIHETDLERFLREALQAGNFPLAIRLYYLQAIKLLSQKGDIRWSREKTNRDYLREMRDHWLGADFRAATRDFERVWYGNEKLDAAAFAALEPAFQQLLSKLQSR